MVNIITETWGGIKMFKPFSSNIQGHVENYDESFTRSQADFFDHKETVREKGWGLRTDGTPKGPGFLGTLKRPDGHISTELSIGVGIDGKEIEIPSLVPTLTKDEINYLLKGNKPTKRIVDKAIKHAMKRINDGKSPFAQRGE